MLFTFWTYLKAIYRVLKPQGSVVFGCKFDAGIKGASHPFVNTDENDIVTASMEETNFDVLSTKVELDTPTYSYTEIKGIKKE